MLTLISYATVKRATKNEQFVLQHCCKTSEIAILHALPPSFYRVLQKKLGCRVINSFCYNVAKQVARFLLPALPYLYLPKFTEFL